MKNLILLASVVVGECFCTMDIFYENVGNDYEKVKSQVEKATTLDDIRKIVNQYI